MAMTIPLPLPLLLLVVPLGAFAYWTRGGHGPLGKVGGLFKPVFGAIVALPALELGLWQFAVAALIAAGAVSLGHGTALDMGRNPDKPDDGKEHVSILARILFEPRTWAHDALAMFLSGFSYAFGVAILLFPLGVVYAIALGLAKAGSYEIGWRLEERRARGSLRPLSDPTAMNELIYGVLAGAIACGAILA
jgi:hypothetical protein